MSFNEAAALLRAWVCIFKSKITQQVAAVSFQSLCISVEGPDLSAVACPGQTLEATDTGGGRPAFRLRLGGKPAALPRTRHTFLSCALPGAGSHFKYPHRLVGIPHKRVPRTP